MKCREHPYFFRIPSRLKEVWMKVGCVHVSIVLKYLRAHAYDHSPVSFSRRMALWGDSLSGLQLKPNRARVDRQVSPGAAPFTTPVRLKLYITTDSVAFFCVCDEVCEVHKHQRETEQCACVKKARRPHFLDLKSPCPGWFRDISSTFRWSLFSTGVFSTQ